MKLLSLNGLLILLSLTLLLVDAGAAGAINLPASTVNGLFRPATTKIYPSKKGRAIQGCPKLVAKELHIVRVVPQRTSSGAQAYRYILNGTIQNRGLAGVAVAGLNVSQKTQRGAAKRIALKLFKRRVQRSQSLDLLGDLHVQVQSEPILATANYFPAFSLNVLNMQNDHSQCGEREGTTVFVASDVVRRALPAKLKGGISQQVDSTHLSSGITAYKTPKSPPLNKSKSILKALNKMPAGFPLSPKTNLRTCSTPDPALTIVHIGYVAMAKERPGLYEVIIDGRVTNAGQGIYPLNSRPIRATIKNSGLPVPDAMSRNFSGELAPGQSRPFYFRIRHVNSSADFITDYTVAIEVSGPDCNPQNNQIVISGTEISAAIAAQKRSSLQITRVRSCIRPGGSVIVDGHTFGPPSSSYSAMFGATEGTILSWTDRQLILKAPNSLNPDMPMPLILKRTVAGRRSDMAFFGVRTCRSASTSSRHLATPADFHFGTMRNARDRSFARGLRPLLVLLLQAQPGTGATPRIIQDKDYFDQMIFGPNYPNVSSYFKVNSSYATYTGRGGHGFSWVKAAIIGPVIDSTLNSTRDKRLSSVKVIAANNGFDFSRYDRNADGVVNEAELGILVVNNYADSGSVTFGAPGCVDVRTPNVSRPQISVCSGISMLSPDTNMITYAHELSHQLGTIDLYGSTGGSSYMLSLMGATLGLKNETTFNLDPWHRSQLGWIKPRVYDLSQAGSAFLRAPTEQYGKSYNGGPIILYDSRRGTNEYFMLEYREKEFRRDPRGPGFGYGYDASIVENGVSVWLVKTTASGGLLQIPDRVPEASNHKCAIYAGYDRNDIAAGKPLPNPPRVVARRVPGVGLSCGNVSSVETFSPPGHRGSASALPSGWGGWSLWNSSDGDFYLNWLNTTNDADGDDVGIRLRVYGEGKGYAKVRWDPSAR